MPSYYLAPSCSRLRNEVNARWSGRDRTSDGWIGDASHQARPSDHNPDWNDGGVVRAVDLDKDGMDAGWVISCLIQDARTNYVIHDGLIYQRKYGFTPRRYYGPNAHTGHVHLSIRHGKAWENDTSDWLDNAIPVSRPVAEVGGSIPAPGPIPDLPTPLTPITEDDAMTTRISNGGGHYLVSVGTGLFWGIPNAETTLVLGKVYDDLPVTELGEHDFNLTRQACAATFERLHPGYRAVFLPDRSVGYAPIGGAA